MPDKPVTVAAYAAGASLAAITLFYVFGPTFFIDGENSFNTSDGRKRGIIGLSNPANDCFINSVLQALAGLGDLRLYLIKELHRRNLDGPEVYEQVSVDLKKGEKPDKIRDLQQGPVTRALKEMLDALNERPIYKKTISARPMIEALEKAFRTRISRNQQDAQEFFQVVAERLCDEYHAAAKARKASANIAKQSSSTDETDKEATAQDDATGQDLESVLETDDVALTNILTRAKSGVLELEDGFPFEGKLESQIRCLSCGFKNKPSSSTFVSLTLNVPQKSSTTLDHCFDILLKTEDIEDFKCDKCRLVHALEWKRKALAKSRSEKDQASLENDIELIQKALEEDPEKAPEDVELPPSDEAPKRKIRKHMYITTFPKIVAIHLSRSVFDPRSYSTKNMAKVAYPERLRLGGLLDEKWYKLLGIVCHKGSHNSGHYESFRRNHLYPPFATPDVFSTYAAASKNASVVPSADPSPRIPALAHSHDMPSSPSMPSTPSMSSTSLSPSVTRPSSRSTADHHNGLAPKSAPRSSTQDQSRPSTRLSTPQTPLSPSKDRSKSQVSIDAVAKFRRKKKSNDRWWRISDDKIKECKTADVLAMQREVYLIFYELERPGDDTTAQ
jgi:ubiquitin carboxyl-terminal hydrolase 16